MYAKDAIMCPDCGLLRHRHGGEWCARCKMRLQPLRVFLPKVEPDPTLEADAGLAVERIAYDGKRKDGRD